MGWILPIKGLCNTLQDDLIEEGEWWSENLQQFLMYCQAALMPQLFFPLAFCLCYLFLDPDGSISAGWAEGSMYL